jgi:predicted RNA methylase
MTYKKLSPRQALNKAFLKVKPIRKDIETFKTNLIKLLNQINETESEEFHKNLVADFLKNAYYSPSHFINTKGYNDLVIHNGKDSKSSVGVIVEAKKPTNKAEMLEADNLNNKAFQELVLYFLRERITGNNLEVRYLVATNIYEGFVFDATMFEQLFVQDKALVNRFIDFEAGKLSSTKTEFFYKQIAKRAIALVENEIEFTHFDIRDYDGLLRNSDEEGDRQLIALFKLFSPEHLLKLPFANDSNRLDKAFYNELLYIIGLTETKEGSKKLIGRKKEGDRIAGSLLENTINQPDILDNISQLEKPEQFGDTEEEKLFNVGLELVITWINRVLFLKLLEAQLIKYHKGDKSFSFLSLAKVKTYNDLNRLFFNVLACKQSDRNASIKAIFANIPYLNSSLFEPTDIEQLTIFISNLRDENLPIFSSSVLKDSNGKRRLGNLNALEYLFEFLNAYDFSSEGSEEIQEENKTLINASVLGLIFEKINGYKDGSFFTPGFITMYMCRETIRRAVVQKFNEVNGWDCQNIEQLYEKVIDKKAANTSINSLKICDPAVGSGHFLVSALNEIITIKSELKILLDRSGKTLRDYQVEVVNDELIVIDDDGKLFEYNPKSKESQRIQETLFHEKQTIIENCLFGVDINPNSVKICRLRLWIELLKNAYYRVESNCTELETLPNIDINIKCGNSLISRFALDADLKQALSKKKHSIDNYRNAVQTYRNAESKEQKREMERLIKDIKGSFKTTLQGIDPNKTKLRILIDVDVYNLENQTLLFEETKAAKKAREQKIAKLGNEIDKLKVEIEDIESGRLYENALEWRFEFPEVLNNEGDFVGFDVVIGNPPYGVDLSEHEKRYFLSKYIKTSGEIEIYCYFIELALLNILKQDGYFSFITTNTVYYLDKFLVVRKNIFLVNKIISLLELEKQVFADAPDIIPAIYVLKKVKDENNIVMLYKSKETQKVYDLKSYSKFYINSMIQSKFDNKTSFLLNTNNDKEALINKMNSLHKTASKFKVVYGIKTGNNEKFVKKQSDEDGIWKKCASSADNIKKYMINWKGDFLKVSKDLAGLGNINYEQPKILIQYIRKLSMKARLVCALDWDGEYYPLNNYSFIISEKGYSLKLLLALLNSNLINWYFSNCFIDYNIKPKYIEQLPLPKTITSEKIDNTISQILTAKKVDPNADTTTLEQEIDQLVYQLYELTEAEIKIVEGETN